MKTSQAIVRYGAVLCLILVLSELATSAPAPYDYDSVRDLYEVLLQREALADSLMNQHRIVRKNNNRSPSLRLRFGRRSDPLMYQAERGFDQSSADSSIAGN